MRALRILLGWLALRLMVLVCWAVVWLLTVALLAKPSAAEHLTHAFGDSYTANNPSGNYSYVEFMPGPWINYGQPFVNCRWIEENSFSQADIRPGDAVVVMCRAALEAGGDFDANVDAVDSMREQTEALGATWRYITQPPYFGTPPPNEAISRGFYDQFPDAFDLLSYGTDRGWHERPELYTDGVHASEELARLIAVAVPEPGRAWLSAAALGALLWLRGATTQDRGRGEDGETQRCAPED